MIEGEGDDGDMSIDIEKLQSTLKINGDHCSMSSTIRKGQSVIVDIQQQIFEMHIKDNEPAVVSIGSYYHGKHNLRAMEENKWNCLDHILRANPQKTLDDYLKVILELCPLARSFYGEGMKIDSRKFVQMLLLDGCFILVALLGTEWACSTGTAIPEKDSEKQTCPWLHSFVINDFFLVQNQIPFFILERIYEFIMGKENSHHVFSDKICGFIENFFWDYPKAINESNRPSDFHHLLHLSHIYFRPSQVVSSQALPVKRCSQSIDQWRHAMQYELAGVKFEKREFDERNPHSLLDVRYTNNVMYVPYWRVDENTASIFKNLIALEQTNPNFGNDIRTYIIFISQLVTDVKDLALFVRKGIIGNPFGNDQEVLDMLKELNDSVEFDFNDSYYLKRIHHDLEENYQSQMKWWKGGRLQHITSAIHNWV